MCMGHAMRPRPAAVVPSGGPGHGHVGATLAHPFASPSPGTSAGADVRNGPTGGRDRAGPVGQEVEDGGG